MMRRSSRTRQQPTSAYDDELKNLADRKYKSGSNPEISDIENEVQKAMMEEDDENDDIDTDEEEFSPKRPVKVSPPTKASRPDNHRVVQTKKISSAKNGKNGKMKRTIQSSVSALAKKFLDPSETPETSLVAALLAVGKPDSGGGGSPSRSFASQPATMYTAHLESVARKLLQDHPEAASMHVHLLNLLFRSVGGNLESNLPDNTDLEDMDDAQWGEQVTKIVDVMRESDTALLTVEVDDKVGVREYRALYQEFWYRLGIVLLSHTAGSDDGDEDATHKFNSNPFQVELMRDLVSRVTELVMVGQPDLRGASTMAVWELAKASMDRTVELATKLETAHRQHAASKGQPRKLQALQHSMDSWKRHKAELEVLVEEAVIQGVFINRYRDGNASIRRESLDALRQFILLRPDMFLKDKYLKYFGWMTSDKDASVRLAALNGLLAPFKHKHDKRPATLQLKVEDMQNVCNKFLPRIAECTDDSQSLEVQDAAMELVVKLASEGFMDDFDDDDAWDRLNLKALDSNSTPGVRKNALYLVLDQLDVFDESDGRSVVNVAALTERQQIARINGIAQWVSHILVAGAATLDKINVERTDHVVQSLREMPEHKGLTTCWPAILKAIRSESSKKSKLIDETAKTLILLRFMACAAELEAGEGARTDTGTKRMRDGAPSKLFKEGLAQALLTTLPGLLTSFMHDYMSMRSLTRLPRYLLSEVYSLPTRKNDFSLLVKNLCLAYLASSDDEVLIQIAASLATLVQGKHARVADVKSHIKRTFSALQDRLMELFFESDPETSSPDERKKAPTTRGSRRSDSTTTTGSASETVFSNVDESEIEHSICLCLIRLKFLLKQLPLSLLFDEVDDGEENEVEGFCRTVSEALGKRLMDRKPVIDEDDADTSRSTKIASVWKSADLTTHREVAKAVDIGLDVLLSIVAWKVRYFEREIIDNAKVGVVDDEEVSDHIVIRLRDGLAKLVGLCFEQFLEEQPGLVYSIEQEDFSADVQVSAGRVASDLRTLFPREWSSARNPTLRSFALLDDVHLIGGFVRYLNSREDEFVDEANVEDIRRTKELVLPIARSLTANWTDGNRREAGIVLSHLAGKGKMTKQTVHVLARMLKKINPVRFLESQMAALRMAFQVWLDGEPEELDSDHPSEEQMYEFEAAEKAHAALFHAAEQLASRLSMTLGVGKLTDVRLSQALLNFMQEGIRFAFEGDLSRQDDLVLGSRLPFLLILLKYASWIKTNKNHRELLATVLFDKEAALRVHPEFDEVHQDDLQCIRDFQGGLKISVPQKRRGTRNTPVSLDDPSGAGHASRIPCGTPSSMARSTSSRAPLSTSSSQRSRISVQSNLSPLVESPEDREDDDSALSPQKRRRLTSSLLNVDENRMEEEGLESDDSSTKE